MKQSIIYIPSIEAKDLYISNYSTTHFVNTNNNFGYSLYYKDGTLNLNKFIYSLDLSLDLLKLREVYFKKYRNRYFSTMIEEKEYTTRIINVTFQYSVKNYNKINHNLFVKLGYTISPEQLTDNIHIENNELIAIRINEKTQNPISEYLLNDNFVYEDDVYKVKSLPTQNTVANLRNELYENGFYCDGVKYIRYKRSSGSARVGKCLFIDEQLYKQMHTWSLCGLKIPKAKETDLAALESYLSLTLSSIIDTVTIRPENILVVDDYISSFSDEVVAVRLKQKKLHSEQEHVVINNSIWDGQSLLDSSIFGKYKQYGMLLLRNRFFKSCCFNANITKWFADNNITDISQLNGKTLATKIEDIKLITTPSSIKYLKFGSLEQWLKRLELDFGIVKHEKPTYYFNGRMVQTHYQLLNTLQMTYEETKAFIQPSLDYMDLLKTEPAVMRNHIKYNEFNKFDETPTENKNDIIYKMIGINENFTRTKIYYNFVQDLIKSFKKNIRLGHVLVPGTYATLLGNPIEMLQMSIHKFKGKSQLGTGNIYCKRFKNQASLLGSRSPHVTMGNVWLTKNVHNPEIDRYFNLTNEIVCINSIGENTLERLSSADFDSDTVLLTDAPLLIHAAKRNYNSFKVPTNLVAAEKTSRTYINAEKVDLDIKTSVNKIGEIINLSQELNSQLWDRLNNGETIEQLEELYFDISKLDVLSCIEIDKAKKEYALDTVNEIKKLKKKYILQDSSNRTIRPYFFDILAKTKGYQNGDTKSYICHKTTMDFLQKCIDDYTSPYIKRDFIPFSELLKKEDYKKGSVQKQQIELVLTLTEQTRNSIKALWTNDSMTNDEKYTATQLLKNKCIIKINQIKFSKSTLYKLLTLIESDEYKSLANTLFSILFCTANKVFYQMIKDCKEPLIHIKESVHGTIQLYHFQYNKQFLHRTKTTLN